MPSSTSRSRSRENEIRRFRSNPRASLDSRVENVVLPPDNNSVVTRSVLDIAVRVFDLEAYRVFDLEADCLIDLIADRVSILARFLHEVPDLHGVIDGHNPDLLHAVTVHLPVLHDEVIVYVHAPLRRRYRFPSSDRIRAPCRSLASDTATVLSREKFRSLRSWMLNGLSPAEAKALREIFNPWYEGSFTLQCPILDESMGRTLKRLKGSSGSVIDFVEKTWLSTQALHASSSNQQFVPDKSATVIFTRSYKPGVDPLLFINGHHISSQQIS
ncbi:hypothetical protein OUZ56_018735 [Daphnia magna]|uniref:Uncharacterized protein n=1 Tax=Daphnia magna TaxID=35525 RepID=A0ABQ9Z9M4_9CRUS|nr:hypothetical protein OUZ56_018735 [Daphnia magna]